jgi:hypothetical protein
VRSALRVPTARVAELDVDPVDAKDTRRASRHLGELLLQSAPPQKVDGKSCEHRRLVLPLLGSRRPAPGTRGEATDHDRGREIDREREPVLAVGERERVPRRQKEPVEREHARDRYGQCEP